MSDLVERVAQLYWDKWQVIDHGLARKALAIALEEAATVAEAEIVPMAADLLDVGKQLAGRKIANAIRAMIKD